MRGNLYLHDSVTQKHDLCTLALNHRGSVKSSMSYNCQIKHYYELFFLTYLN
jgi:hypothetical protein